MVDFIVTITDPDQIAGITWAREEYNKALPPPIEDGPPPAIIATDNEYIQWIVDQASISYADQKLRQQYQIAYDTELKSVKDNSHVEFPD